MARKKSTLGKQGKVVMKEYGKGRLRSSSGKPVETPEQAFAIAKSEERAAKSRGTTRRTFRGRTRVRPKLKAKR